ncbi:MAG TPA: hypothetical protein VHY91_25835 [Pirellulales bacterium]|jgi:hypothetical protein|nr:hypothetical protein [Pirellulales bacterium]
MIRTKLLLVVGCALCWGASLAGTSNAQQTLASPRIGGYPTMGQPEAIGAGGVGRPAVSPYSNLILADGLAQIGVGGGYQTLVQPFVQQRMVNNSQTASMQRLQRQVNNVESTTVTSTRRPNQIIRDTGHQTRSLNYSHYYPTTTTNY